jgi:hypothetical protein
MTSNFLTDSVNAGLTKVLKDIATTYPSIELQDLLDRYVPKQTKKAKRQGHVSAYNIFVKEDRPLIVAENEGIEFKAISKKLGERWAVAKACPKTMAALEAKMAAYVADKAVAPTEEAAAVVDDAAPVKTKTKAVLKKKSKKTKA